MRDIGAGTTRAPLIQAVLAPADALALEVVAEGVEHDCQARLLRSLGCGRVQSCLDSRAVPACQLTPPSAGDVPALAAPVVAPR